MANTAEIHIKLTGTNSKTIEKRAAALNMLSASVAKLSTVGKALPSISTSANNFARGVQQAGNATETMGKKVQTAGNYLDNFGNLFSRMIRIMAAFTIITTVTRVLTELVSILVKAPAQLELWNTQLRTLSGSATLASQRLKLLQDVAIETPLELPDLFQGLTTLQAFNVEISERTLPLITDLAAISGRTFQDISEVVGKVIQGSATAITRSLPTVGIDPQEFKARAAELGSRAEALFTIVEERFKDFAKESALTTIGIVSNIKDAFTVIAAEAGTGLLVAFRPLVKEVFAFLETIRNDEGALRDFQERLFNVGRSLVNLAATLRDAGRAVVEFSRPIFALIDALGGWQSVLSALIGLKVAGWARGTGLALVTAFDRAQKAIKKAKGVIAALGLAIRAANPWVLAISTAIGAGISVFTRWRMAQGEARRAAEELTAANAMLAESLAEVNRGMQRGIDMVDASAAQRVGQELQDLSFDLLRQQDRVGITDGLQDIIALLQIAGFDATQFQDALDGVFEAFGRGDDDIAQDIFEKALADLFALGQSYKDVAALADEAANDFASINIPAIGVVGASTADTIEQDIARFREFFDFLQLRREFDLVETEEYGRALSTLLAAIPSEIQAAFDKTDVTESVKTRVIRSLDELLKEVKQAQTDLSLGTIELTERVQQAVAIPAMDGAITAASPEEIMSRIRATQAGFAEQIETDFENLEVDFSLGLIDDSNFDVARQALIERIDKLMAATSDEEFLLELKQLKFDIQGPANELGDALSQAIYDAIATGADALADALALLVAPLEDQSVLDVMRRALASILDTLGNVLIQTGIAALGLQKLLANITSPAAATAAIAAGIALKAYAKSITNKMAATSGSSGSGSATFSGPTTTGPIDFGTVSPQPSSVINLNINTIDAAGVSQFVRNNAEELGNAVVYVADRDRATAGEAFGVFTPAFGG